MSEYGEVLLYSSLEAAFLPPVKPGVDFDESKPCPHWLFASAGRFLFSAFPAVEEQKHKDRFQYDCEGHHIGKLYNHVAKFIGLVNL